MSTPATPFGKNVSIDPHPVAGMGASVALSDQLGAMALVDELRHRESLIDELIDLPRRREEVTQKLREHYARSNMAVKAELIEEGVRAYFDRRLRFELPEIAHGKTLRSRIGNALASAYITRKQWRFSAFVVFASLILVSIITQVGIEHSKRGYQEKQANLLAKAVKEIDETRSIDARFDTALGRVKDQAIFDLEVLEAHLQSKKKGFDASSAIERLSEIKLAIEAAGPSIIEAPAANGFIDDIKTIDVRQAEATGVLVRTQFTLDTFERYSRLQRDDAYQSALSRYDVLRLEDISIRGAVAQVSAEELLAGGIKARIDQHLDKIKRLPELVKIEAERDDFVAKARFDDSRAVAAITAVSASIDAHVAALDADAARKALTHLQGLVHFIAGESRFTVVDGKGVKSGVERTWRDDTTGRNATRWYLVVEALGVGGEPVAVPVKSAETGKVTLIKRFAVSVDRSVYQRIREDKVSDGRIDAALIGVKPAGAFDVNFTLEEKDLAREEENNPGHARMIVEW